MRDIPVFGTREGHFGKFLMNIILHQNSLREGKTAGAFSSDVGIVIEGNNQVEPIQCLSFRIRLSHMYLLQYLYG